MRRATHPAKAKWGVNARSNDTTNTNLYSNEIAWGHNQQSQVKCKEPQTQKKAKQGVNASSNDTTNTNLCSNEIAWGHNQ